MIKGWHLQRGWSDIGYHWFIKFDGTVEAGRPEEKAGAHCSGENHDSIGVCLAGLKLEDFTEKQFASLRRLLDELNERYGRKGRAPLKVFPHNHYNPGKSCPVFDLEAVLAPLPQRSLDSERLKETSPWKTFLRLLKLFWQLWARLK